MADECVLIEWLAPSGDRLNLEHRIHPPRALGPRIFAISAPHAVQPADLAFEDDLGIGRHVQRNCFAAKERPRPLQHSAGDPDFVGIERREAQRADEERGVMADDDRDRTGRPRFSYFFQMMLPSAVSENWTPAVLVVHHVPIDADIVDAGFGIAHHRNARGNVFAGVFFVVGADRQFLDVTSSPIRTTSCTGPVSTISGSMGLACRAAHSLTKS